MKYLAVFFLLLPAVRASFAQVNTFNIDPAKLDRVLMKSLDTIYEDDQTNRLKIVTLMRLNASPQIIDSLKKVIRMKDSMNVAKLNAIVDKYGWLGPQKVGMNGSQALFLVIQHADLATQERYLPVIRAAVKEGKTLSSNLAILEDRVAMRKGERQIYGSQGFKDINSGVTYIYPVIDPDNLDKRRLAMGMPSMKEYLEQLGLKWNLEEYKKQLPEIERAAGLIKKDP